MDPFSWWIACPTCGIIGTRQRASNNFCFGICTQPPNMVIGWFSVWTCHCYQFVGANTLFSTRKGEATSGLSWNLGHTLLHSYLHKQCKRNKQPDRRQIIAMITHRGPYRMYDIRLVASFLFLVHSSNVLSMLDFLSSLRCHLPPLSSEFFLVVTPR